MKEIRLGLGVGQADFASALGTDAGTLSKWESGIRAIPLAAVIRVADLAPAERKKQWLDAAGLNAPEEKPHRSKDFRRIHLLKSAAVLGTLDAMKEAEQELAFEIPRQWLPAGGEMQAIRVPDGGMSPMLAKGAIAIVDVSRRKPDELLNTLVVSRDGEGEHIRWLRRELGQYVLLPHELREFPMKALDTRRHYGLLGQVVLWLGRPPEM